jgi:hypothetical protein
MRATAAAATPHGLVLAYRGQSVREGGVGVYDPETDERTQELPVEGGLPDGIFFADEQLVVSARGAIHFFEWRGASLSCSTESPAHESSPFRLLLCHRITYRSSPPSPPVELANSVVGAECCPVKHFSTWCA